MEWNGTEWNTLQKQSLPNLGTGATSTAQANSIVSVCFHIARALYSQCPPLYARAHRPRPPPAPTHPRAHRSCRTARARNYRTRLKNEVTYRLRQPCKGVLKNGPGPQELIREFRGHLVDLHDAVFTLNLMTSTDVVRVVRGPRPRARPALPLES